MDKVTFDSYINNPGGKGSSFIPNKELIRQTYSKDWDELRLRENGLIMYHLYKGTDDYYVHFKIPSGLIDKFYYDVIIRFYKLAANQDLERNLNNYGVQFYSNDPNFVFTFCYAFRSHGLFIKDLEYKMSKLALKEPAKIKNPRNEVGYVKSIYYAYLEMKSAGLFNKGKWETVADKYNKNVWNNTVAHADDKIKDAQDLQYAKRKEDRRLKAAEKNKNAEFERNSSSKKINKTFESPNPKDFGHFKDPTPNRLGIIGKTIEKGFGRFKKNK